MLVYAIKFETFDENFRLRHSYKDKEIPFNETAVAEESAALEAYVPTNITWFKALFASLLSDIFFAEPVKLAMYAMVAYSLLRHNERVRKRKMKRAKGIL